MQLQLELEAVPLKTTTRANGNGRADADADASKSSPKNSAPTLPLQGVLPPELEREILERTARREARRERAITPENAAGEIIKRLERLTATGMGMRELFEDFIKLTNLTLDALPLHWEQLQRGESPKDSPEGLAKWNAVLARYRSASSDRQWVEKVFAEMFAILLLASEDAPNAPSYHDVLGEVYMGAISHGHHGEFYTPQSITRMMAQMLYEGPRELCEHLAAAIGKSEFGQMMQALDVDVSRWAFESLLACYDLYADVRENYQPVTCSDPCCGSGGMFLAFAGTCPRAAIVRGLVKFFGQDISLMAVEMCKLNFRLYGLNGWVYELVAPTAGSEGREEDGASA